MAEEKLRVLIFGAGAIGGYLGGSLALQGHRVVFLEREHNAPTLRENGLQLSLGDEIHTIKNIEIMTTIGDALSKREFDVALFALKSYDTAAALDSVRPHAAKMPTILCLQNGIENETAIATVVGAENVIAGTVTTAVAKDAPDKLRLERLRGAGIAAGHPLSARLAEVMKEAGLNARLYPDGVAMKWSKLLTNLLTNASCAILNMTPAEVMADPDLFNLEMSQLREALAVMDAFKLKVVDLPGTPVRALGFAARRLPTKLARPLMARAVGRGRGGKMPSLHIDLHSGKGKSEVDWLNGAVVRAGKRAGVPTPVNQLLVETLSEMLTSKLETLSPSELLKRGRINTNL